MYALISRSHNATIQWRPFLASFYQLYREPSMRPHHTMHRHTDTALRKCQCEWENASAQRAIRGRTKMLARMSVHAQTNSYRRTI